MSWVTSHSQSEEIASQAHMLARKGDRDAAIERFTEAARAETEALESLDRSKARTVGVTAVSAVALWYKAEKFEEAEKLAIRELANAHGLPAFAIDQLKDLLQAIWSSATMRASGVSFLPGQIKVSIQGGQTIPGGAPLDVIVARIQTVQAFVYRTVEYLKALPYRHRGAPSREIQEACAPWLLQAPTGSYQFAVAIREPAQSDFFNEAVPGANQIAAHFLSIVRASAESDGSLSEIVTSGEYRGAFLKLTRNLAPTGKNFSRLELAGAEDQRPVVLRPEERKAINTMLRSETRPVPFDEMEVELNGILRALHLDEDWLELIVDGESLHIVGATEAIDDVIGPMVNQTVTVRARRSGRGGLQFVDIELDD